MTLKVGDVYPGYYGTSFSFLGIIGIYKNSNGKGIILYRVLGKHKLPRWLWFLCYREDDEIEAFIGRILTKTTNEIGVKYR
jgi:hypothetical protein